MVKIWNGEQFGPFDGRDEAVAQTKKSLASWMNPDDRLAWGHSRGPVEDGQLPDLCTVITEHGEDTDAHARIIEIEPFTCPNCKGHPATIEAWASGRFVVDRKQNILRTVIGLDFDQDDDPEGCECPLCGHTGPFSAFLEE